MIDFLDAHWFASLLLAVATLFALDGVATYRGWYGARKCARCARPVGSKESRLCRRCLAS